ncbi:MAG: F0F1 ATP synthase subunit gamma [Streptosporangiales bacterium]|nr:F0F1 ATP synthase subunit gamma [Streptosporangiales bacterium]
MGAQLRAIRGRIRSTKSIAKITKAQELIASSRIIKAQQRMQAAGPYAREITRAVSALISHHPTVNHPLLTEKADGNRAAILLLTSDSGFCGGFNANVLRESEALVAKLREEGKEPVAYIAGRKGADWYRFRDRPTEELWSGFSAQPAYVNAEEVGHTLVEAFRTPAEEGGVDEIHVVFTEFVSMMTQRPQVIRLLPLEIEEETEEAAEEAAAASGASDDSGPLPEYEFEPSPEAVLDALLPGYVQSRLWNLMLQSAASELAARRRAMKSATDNANDLIEVLTRQANQARQAEITQEISEIVGGADALAESNAGSE